MQAISSLMVTLPFTTVNHVYKFLNEMYGVHLNAKAKAQIKRAYERHKRSKKPAYQSRVHSKGY